MLAGMWEEGEWARQTNLEGYEECPLSLLLRTLSAGDSSDGL